MSRRPGNELVFLPLGGAGEIGMNLNLYGFGPPDDPEWLMVDLGVTFGDGSIPRADVILPDPTFIAERRDRLIGLVLTHAHEDHLGAVPYLWDRLRCPIYATPFTAAILDAKLREAGLNKVPVKIVQLGSRFSLGPFDLELITLTHSIPEPNAIAIRTPLGAILHTGDWKFDPDPVVGPVSDEAALKALGDDGVLAVVCDSTNVFEKGVSGSEASLLETLTKVIADSPNRVAVACFASNVARLETIARAAAANDRTVVIAGRSLRRIEAAARGTGYLQDTPAFVDEADCGHMPRDKVLIICTGSQGEPRAALARIAAGTHPNVALEPGDRVIFSSRVIPGHETSIARLHNQLVRTGVDVITWRDHDVHVSGHPCRDELAHMYALARPKIAVPVHGEIRHLIEHARLAKTCQVRTAIVAENGSMVRLAPGRAEIVDTVPSGRLMVDGNRAVSIDGEVVRSLNRTIFQGSAVVTVVFDRKGRLAESPMMSTTGLTDAGEDEVEADVIAAIETAIEKAGPLAHDEAIVEAVRIATRRAFFATIGKKPWTRVHVVRH